VATSCLFVPAVGETTAEKLEEISRGVDADLNSFHHPFPPARLLLLFTPVLSIL